MAGLDYGRHTLRRFGFIEGFYPIEPGTFLIGNNLPVMRPVPAGEWPYIGIALDRPRIGSEGVMWPSDSQLITGGSARVGRMGEYAETLQARPRIGHDAADRALDTAKVLDRLLDRFHADPRHEQTGFLAESETGVPSVTWEVNGQTYQAPNLPSQAHYVCSRHGWVYASHRKRLSLPEGLPDEPFGWAGSLTLVGQIVCLGAVLADRFAELLAHPPQGAGVSALRLIAGRLKSPLGWTDTERRDLEAARGDLWEWRPVEPLAPRHEGEDGNGASAGAARFAFRDEHLTVLAELAALNRLVKASELEGRSGMPSYDTLLTLLKELESATPQLVERPHSKPRSGFLITVAGREELVRRGLIDPPT